MLQVLGHARLDSASDLFNFADALLGVLGHRLVRRHCPHCRTVRPATSSELDELLGDFLNSFEPEDRPSPDVILLEWKTRFGRDGRLLHHQGNGCDKCGQSGFRGRAGIHELMTVSRRMRHLIQTGARPAEIQRVAMADGMRTLRQDGIEKVLAGIVAIEEVRANSNQ